MELTLVQIPSLRLSQVVSYNLFFMEFQDKENLSDLEVFGNEVYFNEKISAFGGIEAKNIISESITSDLTGNVTGNLTGNVNAGIVTASSSLDVVGNTRITGALSAGQYNITTHTPIQNATFSTSGGGGTVSGTFTIPVKSSCLFSFNGTGYRSSGTNINMTLSVTGIGNLATVFYYTNEINSHKTSPTGYATATLTSGTWTVVITCDGNTDNNDRGNCSVISIPTL